MATLPMSRRKGDVLIGSGTWLKRAYEQIEMVSRAALPVFVSGESGTGKELVARMIHNASTRRERRFLAVNCAAIPAGLIEGELFGYVKGAFTGAVVDRAGVFEAASEGTLFLDEIGEIPRDIQVKLLRALESGFVRRLGENIDRKVNARLISATNRNLEEMVQEGTFRSDLYFRINVFPMHLPPLRKRKDDIPLLVAHFLRAHGGQLGKRVNGISSAALSKLRNHDFPGNVRELENTIRRAIVMSSSETLEPSDIMLFSSAKRTTVDLTRPFRDLKQEVIKDFETAYLSELMAANNGNIAAAARQADMDRKNLWALLRKHGIVATAYRLS